MAKLPHVTATSVFQRNRTALIQFRGVIGGASLVFGVCGAALLLSGFSFGGDGLLFSSALFVVWVGIQQHLKWRDDVVTLYCGAHVSGHIQVSSCIQVRLKRGQLVKVDHEFTKKNLKEVFDNALQQELSRSPDYYGGFIACTERDNARFLSHLQRSTQLLNILESSGVTIVDAVVLDVAVTSMPSHDYRTRRVGERQRTTS